MFYDDNLSSSFIVFINARVVSVLFYHDDHHYVADDFNGDDLFFVCPI